MIRFSLSTFGLVSFTLGSFLYLFVTISWPIPQVLAKNAQPSSITDELPEQRLAIPAHITIGTHIDLEIVQTEYTQDGWDVSNTQVSFPSTSARPGEPGNIVLYSHNWKNLFGNLRSVRKDDEIIVTTSDGLLHHYRAETIVTTDSDDVAWVGPEDHEVLTLYTCTGILDLKRLVIRALPIVES